MAIGETIEAIRRRKKVQQKKLAADLGMKPQQLNKILRGVVKDPGFDVVARLAAALGVSLDEVLLEEREAAWSSLRQTGDLETTHAVRELNDFATIVRDTPLSSVMQQEADEKVMALLDDDETKERRAVEWRMTHPSASAEVPGGFKIVDARPRMIGRTVEALVSAGHGGWDDNSSRELVMLPEYLLSPDSFIVQAVGESMIDEGIDDGDYLIVGRRASGVAAHGDLVIAWLNDGLVIKRWYRRGGKKFLESANEEMGWKPREILPDDVFEIQGIVEHIVKRASNRARGAGSRVQRLTGEAPPLPIDRPRKRNEEE